MTRIAHPLLICLLCATASAASAPGVHETQITITAGETVTFGLASSEVAKVVPAVRLRDPDVHYPHVKVTLVPGEPSHLLLETTYSPGVGFLLASCESASGPCTQPVNIGVLQQRPDRLVLVGSPAQVILSEFRWARVARAQAPD